MKKPSAPTKTTPAVKTTPAKPAARAVARIKKFEDGTFYFMSNNKNFDLIEALPPGEHKLFLEQEPA